MFTNPQRNHPFFIAERTYSYLLLLGIILLNGMTAAGNEASIYSLTFWKSLFTSLAQGDIKVLFSGAGAIILLIFVIIISALRWSRTFFSINEDVLVVEKKTIFKKTSRLPAANITTVNIERNVFERALGVSKVKIDINSSATADRTDFTFVLKESTAAAFKDELLRSRVESRENTDSEAEQSTPLESVINFTSAQAVRHKLLSIPLAQVIVALLVLVPLLTQSGEDISFWQLIGVSNSGNINGATEVFSVIAALLFIYLIPTVLSLLNYCKFSLSCDNNKIYITRGLLKTFNYTFEKSRINAVIVRQPMLARIFKLYSIEVAVVGLGNEKNETSQLCLLSDKATADRVLNICAADFHLSASEIPSSKAALVPSFVATAIFTALAALLFLYKPIFGIIGVAACAVFGIICSILGYKTKKLAYDDNIFSYTSGILSKKTVFVKYCDIQTVSYRTNQFLKKFNAGRIRFTILSGQQAKVQLTGWFPSEYFERVAENTALAPDALL